MDKPADDRSEPIPKARESTILDAFKSRREVVTGKFTGDVLHSYSFQYNENVPSSWYDGTVFPLTTDKQQLGKQRGNEASFWIFEPKEEKRLRELTSLLLPLSDNAIMQPLHVAYNSQIDKTVVCCTPCNMVFTDWISKEVPVPVDGYISDDAKNLISSMLLLSEVLWDKGLVCDGLDNPSNYVMKDSRIQLMPFHIREKRENDTKMAQRNQLADLLHIHLNARWNDSDATQFIAVLRNPAASLKFLLNHPLLLPSDRRMSVFLLFNKTTNLSTAMMYVYNQSGFHNWIGLIPPSDAVLQKLLTYHPNDKNNTTCTYIDTPVDAHRFCRNTCSHYISHWRKIILSSVRSKAQADMVDKKLKRYFPGFVSIVYALSLCKDWMAGK